MNISSPGVNVGNIVFTPPKEETPTTSMARSVITANELFTAQDNYRTRTVSLPCNVRNLLSVSNIGVESTSPIHVGTCWRTKTSMCGAKMTH